MPETLSYQITLNCPIGADVRQAATSIAETDPAHVNIIKDILGHATLDMSQRHYNRAQGKSAANELQSIVEDMQNSVPMMGRANRNDFDGRP